MILLDTPTFIVKQAFFGSWRVVDKSTGATIVPERMLQEKIGFVWMKLRKAMKAFPEERRAAENAMFYAFASASVHPNGELAEMFRFTPTTEMVELFSREGHTVVLAAQLVRGRIGDDPA